jgi:DNA modification methylase
MTTPTTQVTVTETGQPSTHLIQGDATEIPLGDDSVDVTLGSPPYAEARTYGIGADRAIEVWATWMADITIEALRVTRGAVVWIVDDQVRGGQLRPGIALLTVELYRRGVMVERPAIWRSNKAPSRHGRWWTHAWEYVLAFKKTEKLPYFDWRATATPVKHPKAGAFRQRAKNGDRKKRLHAYIPPDLAHPRDIFYAKVGGGHMGHPMATENEAPYPESLVEQIIPVLCPPAGKVLDPFNGSGTRVAVAQRMGRVGIGIDIRMSQIELTRRRLATPWAAKTKPRAPTTVAPDYTLFGAA